MQHGDRERSKALRMEYSREYSGRAHFDVRNQFRTGLEIAHEEVIAARRIVKQLGGDPGEVTDWRHAVH